MFRLWRLLLSLWTIGITLNAGYAGVGDEAWSFQSLGAVFGSPAVASNGSVYFGSRDGKVYSLDPTGNLRWSFQTGDWVDSSPTLSDDESRLYVGSWDNHLYAISTETGEKLWSYETGSLIACSPALDADGNLFFGSSDGFFYSLNPDGSLRWFYYIGAELDASPAVGEDGSVYVGGFDGVVYSFSNDGVLKWQFAARVPAEAEGSRIAGPIAIGEGGLVYFGSADGYCYAVDSSGDLVWEFYAVEKVDTGVVIGNDGELIFASRSGWVYALDALGVLQWDSYVGDVFFSTPMIDAQGRIYVGSYTGNGVSSLNVLDSQGDIVWEYSVLDYIDSPPVLDAQGRVLFGCYDGALYAIEAEAMRSASTWARFGGDEANRARRLPYVPAALSSRFEEWIDLQLLEGVYADPCFDADQDGEALALEYLLGGDPSSAAGGGLRAGVGLVNGEIRVYLDYALILGDEDISYGLEYSFDGTEWLDLNGLEGVDSELLDADLKGEGWYELRRVYLPNDLPAGMLFRAQIDCS